MAFEYTSSTTELKRLLNAVTEKGVPGKVDDKYMVQNGCQTDRSNKPSGNAKRARKVLMGMGLIDGEFQPTDLWKVTREKPEKGLMEGLKKLYPNENGMLNYEVDSDEGLFNYFKGGSLVGAPAIKMCIANFKLIREVALKGVEALKDKPKSKKPTTTSGQPSKKNKAETKPKADDKPSSQEERKPSITPVNTPQVVINIQLQVPSDTTGDVYEKFFQSMQKNLFPKE